jgi:uncharacterized protein YhjY with autotransporter beta-barrel domain
VTTSHATSVTIDPTLGARGGPFIAVKIVTPPSAATGTAAIAGLKIVFTPAVTFTGTTTFTFALSNAFAVSAPATITVTVQGRPDPSTDPSVTSLVTAMTDAAERFMNTQITNLGTRLGTLNDGGGGSGGGGLSITLNGHSLTTLSADSTRDVLIHALEPGSAGPVAAAPPAPLASAQRLGLWVDGTFDSGWHNGTPDRVGLNSGGAEVSAGVDYRASTSFAFGLSGGFAQDENELITGPNQGTREHASDLAAYAALRLGRSGFLDALIGFGNLYIDTRRFSPVTSSMAFGSRNGNDAFASLTAGERFDAGRFSIAPYLGLTGDEANLNAFTEFGAGIGDLTYGNQAIREVSAVAGVRIEGRYGTQIGDVTPHFAIEFGHRLSATSTDPIWYADRPDTIFPILANQIGSQPLTFDFGESLRLRSGFVFDADYRSIVDRQAVQHLLRLQLSTKL